MPKTLDPQKLNELTAKSQAAREASEAATKARAAAADAYRAATADIDARKVEFKKACDAAIQPTHSALSKAQEQEATAKREAEKAAADLDQYIHQPDPE